MIREYTRICNIVENIHILKVIGSWDQVIFVQETEAIIRKVSLVRLSKQVIHVVLIFILQNCHSCVVSFRLHVLYLSTFCSSFCHGCIYVYLFNNYCINKQRDMSFEFSSILSTVDLSKHLITAWINQKFIQLVNLVIFSVFFFSNWVWLNLYEWALSGNELFS